MAQGGIHTMPTRRTPVARQHTSQLSLTAIKLFMEMRRCRCTCDPDVRFDICPGCERWDELDDHLCVELGLKPWEFPTFENPSARVHPTCQPDERARKLWLALEAGARELRRDERAARKAAKNGASSSTSPPVESSSESPPEPPPAV